MCFINKKWLYSVLFLLLIGEGCDKYNEQQLSPFETDITQQSEMERITIETDHGKVLYRYQPNVIVLDSVIIKSIVNNLSSTEIRINSNLANRFKEGTVIIGEPSSVEPNGFSYLIETCTIEDGEYVYTVTTPDISDIFSELSVDVEPNLDFTHIQKLVDDDGTVYECVDNSTKAANKGDLTFKLSKHFGKESSEGSHSESYGLFVEGMVSFHPQMHISGDIKSGFLNFDISPYYDADLRFGFKGERHSELTLCSIPLIYIPNISIGPLFLNFTCAISIGVALDVSGTVSCGVHYASPLNVSISRGTVEQKTIPATLDLSPIEINATGKVGFPEITGMMQIGLYGKTLALEIRPKIQYNMEMDLDLSNRNLFKTQSSLSGSLVASAEVAFRGNLLQKPLFHREKEFLTYHFPWLNRSWLLIPSLIKGSLTVRKSLSGMKVSYALTEGLMSEVLNIIPGLVLCQGETEIAYHLATCNADMLHETAIDFTLNDLSPGVEYTVYPCVEIMGERYLDEGISFTPNTEALSFDCLTAEDITETSAELKGRVIDYCIEQENGDVGFLLDSTPEMNMDTGHYISAGTISSFTDGYFSVSASGLDVCSQFYYCPVYIGDNADSIVYGPVRSFKTLAPADYMIFRVEIDGDNSPFGCLVDEFAIDPAVLESEFYNYGFGFERNYVPLNSLTKKRKTYIVQYYKNGIESNINGGPYDRVNNKPIDGVKTMVTLLVTSRWTETVGTTFYASDYNTGWINATYDIRYQGSVPYYYPPSFDVKFRLTRIH